jgi:RNA polymerase primary sigma factor
MVRLPQNQLNRQSKIKQARTRLEQSFEREPSSEELSAVLEWNAEDIEQSLRNAQRKLSLDAPTVEGSDDDRSLMDSLPSEKASSPEDGMMYQSLQKEVQRILARLNQRERQIICSFFGIGAEEPKTLGEIARQLDLTKERVRQLKFRALRRLQKTYSTEALKQYLG